MYLTTNGQMQAEAARRAYQWANSTARALAETGQIPNTTAAVEKKFAELAIKRLSEQGIPVSRRLAPLASTPARVAQSSATAAAGAVSEVGTQSAVQLAKNAAANSLRVGGVAAGGFVVLSTGYDLYKLLNDEIDGGEFGIRVAENVATGAGGWAGAAAFGAAGSVVPVFGTAAGLIVGGIVGAVGGSAALKSLTGWLLRG